MIYDAETRAKAVSIGSATDFTFGERPTSWGRSEHFGELLQLQSDSFSGCSYRICDSPYPTERALIFLDNHDQQRERWKPEVPGQPPETPVCFWDGRDIGSCRPVYKHGQIYALAQLYMLAWPYGEPRASVRLMSSYGFHSFDEGPPGVSKDSLHEQATTPIVCRDTPTESPVTNVYDQDLSRYADTPDTLCFLKSEDRQVAVARPKGCYCNLADETGAVPLPDSHRWMGRCAGEVVIIGSSSLVVNATLVSGGAVLIHSLYPSAQCAVGQIVEDLEQVLQV
eukprot:g30736.t1